MGPGFISPEDSAITTMVPQLVLLQWDRASYARKACCPPIRTTNPSYFNGTGLRQPGRQLFDGLVLDPWGLQWDRASVARKTITRT